MRVAFLLTVAAAAVLASSASASRTLQLGITDSGSAYFANPRTFYSQLGQLHSKLLRVHLNWGGRLGVAQRRPKNGFDPDDPAYDWRRYDAIVLGADRYGVQVVFSGHEHSYQRSRFLQGGNECGADVGTAYFTSGGGGADLYRPNPDRPWWGVGESAYHYLRVTVDGPKMSVPSLVFCCWNQFAPAVEL